MKTKQNIYVSSSWVLSGLVMLAIGFAFTSHTAQASKQDRCNYRESGRYSASECYPDYRYSNRYYGPWYPKDYYFTHYDDYYRRNDRYYRPDYYYSDLANYDRYTHREYGRDYWYDGEYGDRRYDSSWYRNQRSWYRTSAFSDWRYDSWGKGNHQHGEYNRW